MTNKNTRSKGEYALDHILWGLISWLWFTKSLFRNIEGLSYDRSRLILLGALTASILLGLAVTWKRRRNNLSLFVNLVPCMMKLPDGQACRFACPEGNGDAQRPAKTRCARRSSCQSAFGRGFNSPHLHQSDPRRTQIVDGHVRMAVLCVIQDSHFVIIEVNLVDKSVH